MKLKAMPEQTAASNARLRKIHRSRAGSGARNSKAMNATSATTPTRIGTIAPGWMPACRRDNPYTVASSAVATSSRPVTSSRRALRGVSGT